MLHYPRIPNYSFVSILGRGGMGIVFHCIDNTRSRSVALKMVLSGRFARLEELARFRIEIEALRCLDHPNILPILDVGVASGCPFLTSPLAEFGTLDSFLAANPQTIEWKIAAIGQIASALHYAHQRCLVHRDVKPANILIDSMKSPKLSDFGLVKFQQPLKRVVSSSVWRGAPDMEGFDQELHRRTTGRDHPHSPPVAAHQRQDLKQIKDQIDKLASTFIRETSQHDIEFEETAMQNFLLDAIHSQDSDGDFDVPDPDLDKLTAAQSILGSPHFMAPEQARGELHSIGPHTDVYSLGATLHFLVTGETLFPGATLRELLGPQGKHSVEWPSTVMGLSPNIPHFVNAIILKCIQKEPERRYQTCRDVARDIELCLSGNPPETVLRRIETLASLDKSRTSKERNPYSQIFKNAFPSKPQ